MTSHFFATPALFREWLDKNHGALGELWVGFYKKDSGKPSLTWPESVDVALCYGWIDGIRKGIDAESYKIRFTPRKPRSIWSAVNIKRAHELIEQGLMRPAGLAAFERRSEDRSAIYAYEQRRNAELSPDYQKRFKKNRKAWAFFQKQPPGFRRTITYWVMSAKQEATRLKRLARLIEDSEQNRGIRELRPKKYRRRQD